MIKLVTLDAVCEVIAGQSPPSSTYNNSSNGVPFYQGMADFGVLYPITRMWCSAPQKISLPNDILMSVRAPVGPTNLNNIKACIGRGLSAIRCSNKIEHKFLLHFLRHNEQKIADKGTGCTFKAITQKTLKSIQIPLPPMEQQIKIAAILDAADTLRQKDQQLIDHYTALSQSLFKGMFGDVFMNDREFTKMPLKMLSEKVQIGPFGSQLHQYDYVDNEIPLINPIHIVDLKILPNFSYTLTREKYESLPNYHLKTNDQIMARRGEMGRCAMVTEKENNYFCGTGSLFIRPNKSVNPLFLLHVLSSKSGRNYLERNSQGVTMMNLNKTIILNLEFGVPKISLQNQFADAIKLIEAQKQQAQSSLEKSEALFNSLLQRAFKGELTA